MKKKFSLLLLTALLFVTAGCADQTPEKPAEDKLPKNEKVMTVNGYQVPLNKKITELPALGCGTFEQTETPPYEIETYDYYSFVYKKGEDYYYFDISASKDIIQTYSGQKGTKCIGEFKWYGTKEHPEAYQQFVELLKKYEKHKEKIGSPNK